jgi:cytochrome b561
VVLYGLLPLPDGVPVSRALAAQFKTAHEVLAWTLGVLIAVHVGAALKHQFIDRDALLRRMWPTRA